MNTPIITPVFAPTAPSQSDMITDSQNSVNGFQAQALTAVFSSILSSIKAITTSTAFTPAQFWEQVGNQGASSIASLVSGISFLTSNFAHLDAASQAVVTSWGALIGTGTGQLSVNTTTGIVSVNP